MKVGLCETTARFYEEAEFDRPSFLLDNPIVFVDPDGTILCRLDDDVWPLPSGRSFMYWHTDDREIQALYDQAKLVLLLILYHPHLYDLAPTTIMNYHFGLKTLCEATLDCGHSDLSAFFSNPNTADEIIQNIVQHKASTGFIHIGAALFNALVKIDSDTLGFRLVRGATYNKLRSLLKSLNQASFQHPVIPWDIYKVVLRESKSLIAKYRHQLDHPAWADVINLFYVRAAGLSQYATTNAIEDLLTSKYPDFELRKPGVRSLLRELTSMQEAARIGVLLFTGCRMSELTTITAAEPKPIGEGIYTVAGQSTKSGHGSVTWVTNEDGANAVRLALAVRKTIATALDLDVESSLPCLFPSLHGFPGNVHVGRPKGWSKAKTIKKSRTQLNNVFARLGVSIPNTTKTDHDFLAQLSQDCRMDLNRYPIGLVFPLTAHQLRRSLAYYAMRSGNVELGALKRQFKHLSVIMTEYYTSSAFGLSSSDENTLADLVAKERLNEIDERLRSHLAEYEQLEGAMGRSMKKNIVDASRDGKIEVIENSRQRILRRAENGEISYAETPLGACLSTEPCLTRNRAEISACLKCRNAVIERPKAERAYAILQDSEHSFLSAQAEHFSRYLLASDAEGTTEDSRGELK